jgi:hypothetical protein
MRPVVIALAAAIVIGAGGVYLYAQQGGADLTGYANTNIDIGATPLPEVCADQEGHAKLVCLADALKAGLTPEMLAQTELPYSVDDAKKWSNFPPMGYRDRVGPTLGDFTADQRGLIKAILTTASSLTPNEGYDELEQILNADDFLIAETGETGFSSSNYHIAFLGTPAATGTWQLYFGGHHLAVSNTYTDGVLTGATPSFRGVEPFTTFTQNGRENAPMAQEQAAFAAVLTSLTPDQAAKAGLADSYPNIIAGPQQDDAIPAASEGIKAGELSADQQALVMAAIATYVGDVASPDAEAILARYQAELAETFIAFSGTPNLDTENDYIRIDGPSIWIEISIQPGRSIPGVHPHTVWRDKAADYGGNGG